MTIRQRIVYNTCLFIHKVRSKLYPDYLYSEFDFNQTNYATRNMTILKITHTKTLSAEKTLVYRGLSWYNKLPSELTDENRINLFKLKLRNYIKENVGLFDKIENIMDLWIHLRKFLIF